MNRELDLVHLRVRDETAKMRSDSQLDLNLRKAEAGESRQRAEMKIKELEQRVQLVAGRVRSEIEMMKMELVTKWAAGIGLATTLIVAIALRV
jgi:hypothetical protein